MDNTEINILETLALSFTIQDETMPTTPSELRMDLVKFAQYVINNTEQLR